MASLAEALYGLPTERLRILVQERDIESKKLSLIPDKRQLAHFLAAEIIKPPSIAAAILRCNVRDLRLLQLLIGLYDTGSLTWDHVVEAAGGAALSDALSTVMTRLEALGLAFRTSDGLLVPESMRTHVPASLSDRFTVVRCLNAYDATVIKRLCDNLHLAPEPNTKTNGISAIHEYLLKGDSGVRVVEPLDAEETEVLNYLVQAGGSAPAYEVASAALPKHTDDFFRYDWQHRWKQGRPRNAVDRMLARGLLYVVSENYGYNLYLILPGDLLRALVGSEGASFWAGPPPAPAPLSTPPSVVRRHEGLDRDVVRLLAFLSTQEAVRTNTGHVHKSSLKNLTRGLSLPDERYGTFVYALCREAGLIATEGEKQIYTITAKGASWLSQGRLEQIQTLFEAWRGGKLWGEMYTEPLQKASDYRQTDTIVEMRRAALSLLRPYRPALFLEIGSLTDALAFDYPLLLAQSTTMGPNLVPSPATFVRLLIGECLYWLGLVELGWDEAAGKGSMAASETGADGGASRLRRGDPAQKSTLPNAEAFRLTSLGACVFGDGCSQETWASEAAPREHQFIVQANAEIFVPPFLEPSTLYQLLTMTEPPSKTAAGNTVALTRESIRRALDQGATTQEILAFLRAHSRADIPQNVEYLIQEVGGKHGHIHIGAAQMYIQVDTPLMLKELQAHREFKNMIVRCLGDTVAVIRAEDPDKVLRDLRRAGYLPVSDDAPKRRVAPAKPRTIPADADPATSRTRAAAHKPAADATVDWERIAQDDGKPWSTAAGGTAKGTPPPDAARAKVAIKLILLQGVRSHRRVEITYLAPGGEVSPPFVIDPHRVTGNYVEAYSHISEVYESLHIPRIQWARLLEERYIS